MREPHTAQIALGGLSASDVGEYAELSTGIEPAPELVQAIHSETEGNPLFVAEVVRLLDAQARIGEADAHLGIPPGVRAVIGQRVGRLSERCRVSSSPRPCWAGNSGWTPWPGWPTFLATTSWTG